MQSIDDLLSQKFRSVFEQHSETYSEESWAKMKEKLNKSPMPYSNFLQIFAKAASVLILVGITAFITYHLTIYTQTKSFISQTDSTLQVTENEEFLPVNKLNKNKESLKEDSIYQSAKEKVSSGKKSNPQKIVVETQTKENVNLEKKNNSVQVFLVENIKKEQKLSMKLKIDTLSTKNRLKKNTNSLYLVENTFGEQETDKKKEKKWSLGAKVSSFYNFSKTQTSAEANFGMGFISDYKLTNHFSLHSGLFLAKNSLQAEGGLETIFSNTDMSAEGNFPTFTSDSDSYSETDYYFYSFDIPLNIYFYAKNFFISTGVSSLLHFNEEKNNTLYYNEQIVYIDSISQQNQTFSKVNSVESKQIQKSFTVFDFAKMINFSVGYRFKQKYGTILIEPYAKIPIGELTSNKISYGLAGISIKYSF